MPPYDGTIKRFNLIDFKIEHLGRAYTINDLSDAVFLNNFIYSLDLSIQQIVVYDLNFNVQKAFKTLLPIYGIFNAGKNSEANATFASALSTGINNTYENLIVQYDLLNNLVLDTICSFPFDSTIGFPGLNFSPSEFLGSDPECDLLLDLDRDNSSGLYPYDYRLSKTLCLESIRAISDTDLFIHTSLPLDSMTLVVHGILDPGLEILRFNTTMPGILLRKINDSSYILKGPRNTLDSVYRLELLNIRYEHLPGRRSAGTRRIEIQGYSAVKAGTKVSAYITIGSSLPFSGRDTTIVVCGPKKISGLSRAIGGQPGGRWTPGLVSAPDDFDSALDLAVSYRYITGDSICGLDTAVVRILRGNAVTPMTVSIDSVLCLSATFAFNGQIYRDTGRVTQTISNTQGCDSVIYQIRIRTTPFPPINISQDREFCVGGDSITLSIDTIYHQVQWKRSVTSFGNRNFARTFQAGLYEVSGLDGYRCISMDSILIRLNPKPTINVEDMLGLDYIKDRPINISYFGAAQYRWSPPTGLSCIDCPVPLLTDDKDHQYRIEVTSAQNCMNRDSILITYRKTNFFVPNVIKLHSTDGGINNKFYIQSSEAGTYDLQIYDRWGHVVYGAQDLTINDPTGAWEPAQTRASAGVYVYKVVLYTSRGEVLKAGDVTVYE